MEQKLSPQPAASPFTQWLGVGFLASGALLLWFMLSPVASGNWWATFILLPVVVLLGLVPVARPHSQSAASALQATAFIIATVAAMFLFGLDWGVYWPLMIVAPGFSVYFMGLRSGINDPIGRAIAGSTRWLGFTMLLLGAIFQLYTYGLLSFPQTGLFTNWWGLFVGLFGFGVFLEAVKLHGEIGRSPATLTFYTLSGWALLTAVLEFIGYNWNQWQAIIGLVFITLGAAQLLASRTA